MWLVSTAAERCEVVESEGQLYLRYLFANGSYGAIEFERVGIMTDFEYKDDLFGEDNSTLAPTMQLIHTQNEGIINAVKIRQISVFWQRWQIC